MRQRNVIYEDACVGIFDTFSFITDMKYGNVIILVLCSNMWFKVL